MAYKVKEIFYSLQGEGFWTGTPMVFVRLALCNLRCSFCDTDFSSFKGMEAEEIAAEARALSPSCRRLCLTGGEPCLQADEALILALARVGFIVHIETNGTRPVPQGTGWVTLSPKEDFTTGAKVNILNADELKLVVPPGMTATPEKITKWEAFPATHRFLQPCSCLNNEEVISFIKDNPVWRLSLQTHKYLDIR